MIRFTCPSCQSTLNAKNKLAGQSRKCPKCGAQVRVPAAEPADESDTLKVDGLEGPPEAAASANIIAIQEGLPRYDGPRELVRTHRYLICNRTSVFAVWSDGSGWMLKTSAGPVSAARNPEMLPSEGSFVLVELAMDRRDQQGLHLRGVQCHKLANRYALGTLEQEEHKILEKVVGRGALNREQKLAVLRYVKESFMPEVWQDSQDVRDFLTNNDYTSAGTG